MTPLEKLGGRLILPDEQIIITLVYILPQPLLARPTGVIPAIGMFLEAGLLRLPWKPLTTMSEPLPQG